MRNFYWAVASFVLALSLMFVIGCSEKTGTGNTDTGGIVGSVQVLLGTDTLRFLPNDSAWTTVTVVVSNPEGAAVPGQKVNLTLTNPELGFLEFADSDLRDTTNSNGRVEAFFRVFNESGDNTINATSGGRSASRNIYIRSQDIEIGSLNINVTPRVLQVSESSEDSALVTVNISDINNVAISGISLPVSANGGRISRFPATNDAGVATTWWYSNGDFGDFEISTRAGGRTDTTNITVHSIPDIPGTLTLTTDRLLIRADNCISRAIMRATLKDAFGTAIVGDTVKFGTQISGSTPPYAITDSLGIATVQFCEFNVPTTEPDSAMVIARYEPWGLFDTVRVWIAEAADVGSVSLGASAPTGTAGVDSSALNVFAQFTDGTPVDGYWAVFYAQPCGSFTLDSVLLHQGRGPDSAFYKFCASIPAQLPEVWVVVDGVESNHLNFTVNPGPASSIDLSAPSTANLNELVQVQCLVVDSFNNPVSQGQVVLFSTSLGAINPPIGQTNAQGVAIVNFNPGTTAGQAVINASVNTILDSTVVAIISGSANTITLSVSATSLDVTGTGGQDWSQLMANVFDANGNPVPDGTWVTFTLLNYPPGGGANINDHGIIDSAQTSNGTATVTLNAGTVQGPVRFQACVDVGGTERCASFDGITIVAGPPFQVFLYPDEIGVDAIGGAWDLEVACLVVDLYQNPVRDGVAVFMEVLPDQAAQILSQNVSTGNPDINGDSRPGLAYTTLRYLSPNTFQLVTLRARTANNVQTERPFILPLQDGFVDLRCDPGSWHFIADGPECQIRCDAEVQDGHDVDITGATVFYYTDRGRLYNNQNGNGDPVSFAITGTDGIATLWLVDTAPFIFPDPLIVEIPGPVNVEVVGYSQATDNFTINFRRGGG
jgi:hypothetical protein